MPNPIADPLVENVVAGELDGLVRIDARPDGVVVVSINQPHIGNALNGALTAALTEAFETLHSADEVRVVFLRGAGGTFCCGTDPAWLRAAAEDWSMTELRQEALAVAAMLRALTVIPALTVALVEGEACDGGVGLATACDVTVAVETARFSFPEVTTGGVPAMIAPYIVSAIGPRQARALFATARSFDTVYAEKIGLVQEVVADSAGLDAAIERLSKQVRANGPQAVSEVKRLTWDVCGRPFDHALLEETARRYARARFSDEGREGLAALLEGRRPSWAED